MHTLTEGSSSSTSSMVDSRLSISVCAVFDIFLCLLLKRKGFYLIIFYFESAKLNEVSYIWFIV